MEFVTNNNGIRFLLGRRDRETMQREQLQNRASLLEIRSEYEKKIKGYKGFNPSLQKGAAHRLARKGGAQ